MQRSTDEQIYGSDRRVEHDAISRGARRCDAACAARPGCCWPIGLAAWPRPPTPSQAKAKAVIQIWMWGGPSHLDTFDPEAGGGQRLLRPAEQADRHQRGRDPDRRAAARCWPSRPTSTRIIRSMTHGNNGHETAAYMVQTGRQPGGRLVYPVRRRRGLAVQGLRGRLQGADSALHRADRSRRGGSPRPASWGRATSPSPPAATRRRAGSSWKASSPRASPTSSSRTAASCSTSSNTLEHAMQRRRRSWRPSTQSREAGLRPDPGRRGQGVRPVRRRRTSCGDTLRPARTFGQSCLVARRLVERGVPYITINYGGWDTHKEQFPGHAPKLPELDKGLATLLAGPVGPRPAGQHDRLVLRRVRPHAQGRVGAALERRTRPLRQGLLRAGRRRRIQGRPRGRRLGCQRAKRSRTGPSIRAT